MSTTQDIVDIYVDEYERTHGAVPEVSRLGNGTHRVIHPDTGGGQRLRPRTMLKIAFNMRSRRRHQGDWRGA